jgi:hypothetical protein
VSRKSREARQREPPGDVGSDSSRSCKTREDQPAGDRSNPSSVPRAGAGGGVARDTYVEIPFRNAYLGSIVDRLEHLTVRGKKPKFLGTMDTIESAYDAARAARRAVPLGWTTCVRDADTNELVRDPRDEAFWAKVAKDGLEK